MPTRHLATESDPRMIALYQRFAGGSRRLTKRRVELLRAMLNLEAPASIREIYRLAGTRTCDHSTVYRSLLAMERLGILRRYFAGSDGVCFAIATTPEPLFLAAKIGNTAARIDLPRSFEIDAAVQRVEESLRALGYTEVSHLVQFIGCLSLGGAKAPEPLQLMPEPEKQVKSTAPQLTPARAAKTERARKRIDAFLRRRFGSKPITPPA